MNGINIERAGFLSIIGKVTMVLAVALSLVTVEGGRARAQTVEDTVSDIGPDCIAWEGQRLHRLRVARITGWAATGVGATILIATDARDRPGQWSHNPFPALMVGTTLMAGGLTTALSAGSLTRKECRRQPEFSTRYRRRARLSGGMMMGLGAVALLAGGLYFWRNPLNPDGGTTRLKVG